MKSILLTLMIFVSTILHAAEPIKINKTAIIITPEIENEVLSTLYQVTNVTISTLNNYESKVEKNNGFRKLPAQSIDSINYTVRVASKDKKVINNLAFSNSGIKGRLVCNNPAIRPLIMSRKAVVLISIDNDDGEPQFVTIYDNHSCREK
ncbi:hypothetical protein NGJ69_19695 [Atlantibacter hermannii]|uniref:hypothetical protein n=1 Tax=Atlantibacter hermannii TaxID=565 RepID=UPI002DBAC919|nr:hypothetical protein [Atlantibacter hermannii]MEB7925930.1 hypothetical protein [Atlantibacter hermannii]